MTMQAPIGAGSGADRWYPVMAMLVAGGGSIVAGGLAAAVAGPTKWMDGSWVAAFLVLVAGVAQIGLAAGQALLSQLSSRRASTVKAVLWNIGCLAVIIGTLTEKPLVVSLGSVPLFVVLVMSLVASRGATGWPMAALLYRALLAVLAVSIPIGIALAWIRH